MGAAKLTAEHKEYIAKQFAAFHGPKEIVKRLKSECGVTISHQRIAQIKASLKQQIREAQMEYLADYSDIPLAHAKERAKLFQKIAREAMDGKTSKSGRPDYYLAFRALELMQRDTEHLKGASANATHKEAIAFLHVIGSGQGDPAGVPADAGPAGPH